MIKDSETPIPMQGSVVVPQGISLDGVTDYFNRASDFTGNADGKELNFSFYFYKPNDGGNINIISSGDGTTSNTFLFEVGNTAFNIQFIVGGVFRLRGQVANISLQNGWNHIRGSVDMNNTSNRYIKVNNNLVTTNWLNYVNNDLIMTYPNHYIGAYQHSGSVTGKGRLFGLFLGREFIPDTPTVDAIFINADGTANTNYYQDYLSAGYGSVTFSFPMTDKATAHINEAGTGDMVQNGVIETADVGANQLQCKRTSLLSGAYIENTTIGGSLPVQDETLFTYSTSFVGNSGLYGGLNGYDGATGAGIFRFRPNSNAQMLLSWSNGVSSSSTRLNVSLPSGTIVDGRSYHYAIKVDLTDTNKRQIILNGEDVTSLATWSTYSASGYSPCKMTQVNVGRFGASAYNSISGENYMDIAYVDDLYMFWDSETNKPKPLPQVLSETGANPLIAHSMDASNLETDLVGNTWTVNGSPTGARGATEFIARSALTDGVGNYLSIDTPIDTVDTKTMTVVGGLNVLGASILIYASDDPLTAATFRVLISSGKLRIQGYNSSGTEILDFEGTNVLSNEHHSIAVSFDLSDSLKRNVIVDREVHAGTWSTYTDDFIDTTSAKAKIGIGSDASGANTPDAEVSNLYRSKEYINIGDESVLNSIINQLGYFRNIKPLIESGDLPTPEILMLFDDTDNLGKNDGTAIDATVNGTPTSGSDFSTT